MVKSIVLDLSSVELSGWESSKNSIIVAAMIEGICLGCKFPPVDIVSSEKGYCLNYGSEDSLYDVKNYGGHHRAIAHYIANSPLECTILPSHRSQKAVLPDFFSIGEIILDDSFGWKHLRETLDNLPYGFSEKFLADNFLNF
jgi:hypothetical protein